MIKVSKTVKILNKKWKTCCEKKCASFHLKAETQALERQPGIGDVSKEDLDQFDFDSYYEELTMSSPVLHSAVLGSMGSHLNFGDIQVNLMREMLIIMLFMMVILIVMMVLSIINITMIRNLGAILSVATAPAGRSPWSLPCVKLCPSATT